jgi:CBS domain-containing protein
MLKLRDIMTTDLVTVTPQTSLRDAMELLAEHHVSGAPVVSGNKLVGVISASDLLGFVCSTPETDTRARNVTEWGRANESDTVDAAIEKEDVPGGTFFSDLWDDGGSVSERMATADGPEWNVFQEHDVSEAMTRPLITLPPDADITVAADLMRQNGIHRILVIEHETLVGIVSAIDIAAAVADHKLETRRYVFTRGAAPSRRRP